MGRYRKTIEFDVIKETEKAVLINVKDCKSTAFRKLVKKAKKHMVLIHYLLLCQKLYQ